MFAFPVAVKVGLVAPHREIPETWFRVVSTAAQSGRLEWKRPPIRLFAGCGDAGDVEHFRPADTVTDGRHGSHPCVPCPRRSQPVYVSELVYVRPRVALCLSPSIPSACLTPDGRHDRCLERRRSSANSPGDRRRPRLNPAQSSPRSRRISAPMRLRDFSRLHIWLHMTKARDPLPMGKGL